MKDTFSKEAEPVFMGLMQDILARPVEQQPKAVLEYWTGERQAAPKAPLKLKMGTHEVVITTTVSDLPSSFDRKLETEDAPEDTNEFTDPVN